MVVQFGGTARRTRENLHLDLVAHVLSASTTGEVPRTREIMN